MYTERQKNEDFAVQMADTLDLAVETLEASAYNRALQGDTLLTMFVLKSRKPHLYRDNYRVPNSVELDEVQLEAMTSAIVGAMTKASLSPEQERVFRESLEERLLVLEQR